MPIGLLFYIPVSDPTQTLAIEASEVVRFGMNATGNVEIRTKQGEILETSTPMQKLIDDYTYLVAQSLASRCC